jgi:calcineurin-like phosphoesterase family protein
MSIFVISDTHFNHCNIIEYANRPFIDIDDMNEQLILNWNSVVSPNDEVIHCGDICMGSKTGLRDILPRLQGKITLIRGNHDKKKFQEIFDLFGIRLVQNCKLIHNGVVCYFSHKAPDRWPPEPPEKNFLWFFGHTHKPVGPFDPYWARNICVENINYTPQLLDDYIKQFKESEYYAK